MESSSRLLQLPAELCDSILRYLEDASLCSARLTCQELKPKASTAKFASTTVAKSRRSIVNAPRILQHDGLRANIHTLLFDASAYIAVDGRTLRLLEDTEIYLEEHPSMTDDESRMLEEELFEQYSAAARIEQRYRVEGVVRQVLVQALKLPKLKHIVFADYRRRRRPEEQICDLWARLFGSTFPPRHASERRCFGSNELSQLLSLADEHHVPLKSLKCGKYQYASEATVSVDHPTSSLAYCGAILCRLRYASINWQNMRSGACVQCGP